MQGHEMNATEAADMFIKQDDDDDGSDQEEDFSPLPMQGIFSNEKLSQRVTSAHPESQKGRDERNSAFMNKMDKQE